MKLYDLPLEVIQIILAEMAINVGILHALRLRLICRLFNQEIPSAICATNLFDDDPGGAKVTPESGLQEKYLFKLTANANNRARDLPAVINGVMKFLVTITKNEKIPKRTQDSYTRVLCGAAVAYLFVENPEYLRYPPAAADPSAPGSNLEITSVHVLAAAAFFGYEQFVKNLPKDKFSSDLTSQYFGNPLVLAAQRNHYNITKLLLERRDNSRSAKGHYKQALNAAARAGHDNIVQLLLQTQHMQGDSKELYKGTVIEAIKGGHARLAQSLIKQGSIDVTTSMQTQILHSAIHHGHEDIVREALENGADPNLDNSGHFALSHAVTRGHSKIVRLLISYGSDLKQKGRIWSPLMKAVGRGYREVTQILLDNGADINGGGSYRPLSVAASSGQYDMFSFLVRAGADLSYMKYETDFSITGAALGGYETMIQILISHGTNIKAAGKEVVLNAMLGGHGNVVKMLLEFGTEKPQQSLLIEHLHKAVKHGSEDWVRNLIAQGVDMNAPHPVLTCTPLWWAMRSGHPQLARTLVEMGAKYRLPMHDGKKIGESIKPWRECVKNGI